MGPKKIIRATMHQTFLVKKIILILLAAVAYNLPVYAEIISLKSGKTVEGKIIEKSDSFIKLDIGGIAITYYFDQIKAIDGKEIVPVAAEQSSTVALSAQEEKPTFRNWEWGYLFQYPKDWETIPVTERKDSSMGFRPKGKKRELVTIELYRRTLRNEEIEKTKDISELQKMFSVPPELKKESEGALKNAKEPGYLVRYTGKLPFVLTNVAGSGKNVQGATTSYQDYYYFSPAYLSKGKDPRFFTVRLRYTKYEPILEKDNQGVGADIIRKQNELVQRFNQEIETLVTQAKEIIQSFSYILPPSTQKGPSVSLSPGTVSSKGLSLGKMKDIQDCLQRAVTFVENKKFTEATGELKKALAIDPNLAEAYRIFGYLYAAQDNPHEAITSFKKALQIAPQYVDAYVGLGDMYVSIGKSEDALLQYTEALKLNPDNMEAERGMGFVYNALGRYEEAIEAFKKVIARFPNYGEAYAGIGYAYAFSGQYDEAKSSLQKARELFKEKGYEEEVKKIDALLKEMP
ncbi:MAG: tetratricopeptide repeat protein [Candidatus Omnitrophica bacterium]|nr:tetratricopeptide repeat protein [Candidatus Omnitrophota bacterium]